MSKLFDHYSLAGAAPMLPILILAHHLEREKIMVGDISDPLSHPLSFTATWRQRRVTDQFQDDPLRNLAMSKHALTKCSTLLETEQLLDLKDLLVELNTKTRADLSVYRKVSLSLSEKAITPREQQFNRTFCDGPLQVLANFSLSLEFCLLLLSQRHLRHLENELHRLQKTLGEHIAACYHWAEQHRLE